MSSAVYRQIGPYTIERPIGQGGMAAVFLARDTRSNALVALKVVHLGTDEDAREVQAAEERGADLQKRFSAISRYVPKVFESGFSGDYFFIAMEYVEGEDLSQAIHRGRLPWPRAVGITIQLCEFLEEAVRFERIVLHNDLKPRNIRLLNGTDQIKVLDFGAAKALSLSRKVTRNDFGSIAYLSPECLDSGDRDLHTDAWALGVLLYEMVRGRQPFRAGDTRHLERLIRSRRPPEPLGEACPRALEAVIAKLLAPYPGDRYDTPAAIRADLLRVQAGVDTLALTEGWPDRLHDEPATRAAGSRVAADGGRVFSTAEASAKAVRPGENDDEPPTRRTKESVPTQPPRKRRRILLRIVAVMAVLFMFALMNESCVSERANALAATVGVQDFQGLTDLWPEYRRLADRSGMGWGVAGLEEALTSQTMVLAERVMANYRTPQPTVRENQWKAAADALRRAVAISPGNSSLRAALSYCDGHLLRINGEALKSRSQRDEATQAFADAVVAFREAAGLRPNWPDPFLGLARTFIYGLEDVDRGLDAIAQAEKNGHQPTDRETMQLADGYRVRGETLVKTAETIRGMAQEKDYLTRARDDFKEALKRYESIAGFGNVGINIRFTQKRLDLVEERLKEIEKLQKPWWWPWV
jgi:serine/threonine protein kinase/tetratricopeptide (TPR) repeat protein